VIEVQETYSETHADEGRNSRRKESMKRVLKGHAPLLRGEGFQGDLITRPGKKHGRGKRSGSRGPTIERRRGKALPRGDPYSKKFFFVNGAATRKKKKKRVEGPWGKGKVEYQSMSS